MKAPRWRLAGTKPEEESGGKPYTPGLLRFNGLVVLAFCALQVLLAHLQLNPHGFGVVSADSDVVYRFVA
jgi:K+-transporting ATPase ATPase A chain